MRRSAGCRKSTARRWCSSICGAFPKQRRHAVWAARRGRLAAAWPVRERLRRRLLRRGLAPSAAMLATLLNHEGASASTAASMPQALVTTTVEAALATAAGSAAVSVSAPVAALVGHVVRSMGWTKAMITIGVLGAFGAVLVSAAALSRALPEAGAAAEVVVAQETHAPAAPDIGSALTPAANSPLLTIQNPAPAGAAPKADVALIDDKTERAIKAGLAWLAKVQR